jgi:hypothetical protein
MVRAPHGVLARLHAALGDMGAAASHLGRELRAEPLAFGADCLAGFLQAARGVSVRDARPYSAIAGRLDRVPEAARRHYEAVLEFVERAKRGERLEKGDRRDRLIYLFWRQAAGRGRMYYAHTTRADLNFFLAPVGARTPLQMAFADIVNTAYSGHGVQFGLVQGTWEFLPGGDRG